MLLLSGAVKMQQVNNAIDTLVHLHPSNEMIKSTSVARHNRNNGNEREVLED